MSEPFVTTGTINGAVYGDECLTRLIKFIQPIEKFWPLCKAKYKSRSTISANIAAIKRHWNMVSRDVARNSAKNLFNKFGTRLLRVATLGVTSVK